jgi:CheY-like chemotaxis protein/anti-sigma regulatory factor (Ser/Thr protein kinase)
MRVVSLRDVLAPSILEHEVISHAKGLQLHHEVTPAWVHTDPDLVRRVAGNLLSNAVRYTVAGSVTLKAQVVDGHAWVCIVDTGIGIAPEDQGRIFEEFVQVANPARDRDKGVGLGLSIVRRIANLLDMELTLQSTPSVGTTVTFRIPVAENIHGVTAQEDLTYAAAGAFKGARIWIVEDDPLVRDALSLQFNIWEALPAFAISIAELLVLQGVDGRWPDAAIVDDMLGAEENGLEIATMLREFMPEGRIVLVTGNVDPARTQVLEESGLVVLRKPLASGDLAQWLRQALVAQGARSSPVREPAG